MIGAPERATPFAATGGAGDGGAIGPTSNRRSSATRELYLTKYYFYQHRLGEFGDFKAADDCDPSGGANKRDYKSNADYAGNERRHSGCVSNGEEIAPTKMGDNPPAGLNCRLPGCKQCHVAGCGCCSDATKLAANLANIGTGGSKCTGCCCGCCCCNSNPIAASSQSRLMQSRPLVSLQKRQSSATNLSDNSLSSSLESSNSTGTSQSGARQLEAGGAKQQLEVGSGALAPLSCGHTASSLIARCGSQIWSSSNASRPIDQFALANRRSSQLNQQLRQLHQRRNSSPHSPIERRQYQQQLRGQPSIEEQLRRLLDIGPQNPVESDSRLSSSSPVELCRKLAGKPNGGQEVECRPLCCEMKRSGGKLGAGREQEGERQRSGRGQQASGISPDDRLMIFMLASRSTNINSTVERNARILKWLNKCKDAG